MTVDCPHCDSGTVTKKTGPLWWQRITSRCSYCGGTGRIRVEA